MPEEKVVATLEIKVEYDYMPDMSEIEEHISVLNGAGSVRKAELTVHKETKINLA